MCIKDKKSSEKFKEIFLNKYKNDEFKSNKDFITDKDVIKNIISNIIDKNSRNLLLITKNSLNLLLVNMLREKLEQLYEEKKINKIIPIYKIGSSFEEDKGEEYKIKIINQIIDHAKNGDVIIIQNYSKILPFLYELSTKSAAAFFPDVSFASTTTEKISPSESATPLSSFIVLYP